MKLRQIKLNDNFRSLKSGFELYFSSDSSNGEFNPYCVVGRNGSGKSNILELLGAALYSDLNTISKELSKEIKSIYDNLYSQNKIGLKEISSLTLYFRLQRPHCGKQSSCITRQI